MDEAAVIAAAAAEFGLSNTKPIAQGGQKLVCRADSPMGQVVLKVVLLAGSPDPNALERCEREVSLLRSLRSPNIVHVLSEMKTVGSPAGASMWLEEYLDGQDISQLLGSQWSWTAVEEFLIGAGSGLAAMHSGGYVHRDLSAGNIRRTASAVWKIMDPGFAKHLNRSSITGVWQPGTLGFISPEHAVLGGRVTAASDVFCLGILAYYALTGHLPIPVGGDRDAYRRNLLGVQVPSVGVARPDLTPSQAEIIDMCLQRQPARRFLDGTEVVEAVNSAKARESS